MKDFLNRPAFIRSLEFWAATSILIVVILFRLSGMINGDAQPIPGLDLAQRIGSPDSPSRLLFIELLQYSLAYATFLLLNFAIVPRIVSGNGRLLQIGLALLTMLGFAALMEVLHVEMRNAIFRMTGGAPEPYTKFIRERALFSIWLSILFAGYAAAIQGCKYLLSNLDRLRPRFPFLSLSAVLAVAAWVISLFFVLVVMYQREFIAFWAIFPPSTILLYVLGTTYMIPRAQHGRKPFRRFWGQVFLWSLALFLPIGLLATVLAGSPGVGFPMSVFNSMFQFLLAAPITWVLHMRGQAAREELRSLREKLGRSRANLDFLRSQINPHFLFNALNTIYGTALEEGAARSAEGIHRLGEMMRFMLQENTLSEIPLRREIEYLQNYISLQKLRTDAHPGIDVHTELAAEHASVSIAPMLLIPFVENAFKHGISLRRPSSIRISMELRGTILNFDVHNSRHPRNDNDPEARSSGIGLTNVRERLALLYPDRHELIIRETGREYFVHLSIDLRADPKTVAAIFPAHSEISLP